MPGRLKSARWVTSWLIFLQQGTPGCGSVIYVAYIPAVDVTLFNNYTVGPVVLPMQIWYFPRNHLWLYWGTHQEPCIPISARYSGELGNCGKFLHQCSLVFFQQSSAHPSDLAHPSGKPTVYPQSGRCCSLTIWQLSLSCCREQMEWIHLVKWFSQGIIRSDKGWI